MGIKTDEGKIFRDFIPEGEEEGVVIGRYNDFIPPKKTQVKPIEQDKKKTEIP
jgi:hypothetical protein